MVSSVYTGAVGSRGRGWGGDFPDFRLTSALSHSGGESERDREMQEICKCLHRLGGVSERAAE